MCPTFHTFSTLPAQTVIYLQLIVPLALRLCGTSTLAKPLSPQSNSLFPLGLILILETVKLGTVVRINSCRILMLDFKHHEGLNPIL